jgi:hypothetical protein
MAVPVFLLAAALLAAVPCFHGTTASDPSCNEHVTIYAISSDFGDRMTTQSMELMILLSGHF